MTSLALRGALLGCIAEGRGTTPPPPVGDASLTFANLSASNSPATTPLIIAKGFKRGDVPSGYIAVPTIGSPLTYQADNRTYWDDGSLRHAVFRCLTGIINAGATTQVTFPVSAGSYTNTSSNTTADISCRGYYNTFINMACGGTFIFETGASANANRVIGGTVNQMTVGASATRNVLEDVSVNLAGTGGLTNGNVTTVIRNCFNAALGVGIDGLPNYADNAAAVNVGSPIGKAPLMHKLGQLASIVHKWGEQEKAGNTFTLNVLNLNSIPTDED